MTKTFRILALAASLLIAGCASWQTPSPEALGNLPVVKFGDPIPAGRDYVLFFPPDTPIVTTVSAGRAEGPQNLRGRPASRIRPSGTGLGEDPPGRAELARVRE